MNHVLVVEGKIMTRAHTSETQKLLAHEIVIDMLESMSYDDAYDLLVSLLESPKYKSWKKNSEMKKRSSVWSSDLR